MILPCSLIKFLLDYEMKKTLPPQIDYDLTRKSVGIYNQIPEWGLICFTWFSIKKYVIFLICKCKKLIRLLMGFAQSKYFCDFSKGENTFICDNNEKFIILIYLLEGTELKELFFVCMKQARLSNKNAKILGKLSKHFFCCCFFVLFTIIRELFMPALGFERIYHLILQIFSFYLKLTNTNCMKSMSIARVY